MTLGNSKLTPSSNPVKSFVPPCRINLITGGSMVAGDYIKRVSEESIKKMGISSLRPKVSGGADYVEERILIKFREDMDQRRKKSYCLVNHEEKNIRKYRGYHSSRYTASGRQKIKRKLQREMGRYWYRGGVMLSVTVDHKSYERMEAMGKMGVWMRRFLDDVNKWRVRHHLPEIKGYLRVLESQPLSDYPAPHVVFPGLNYLVPQKVLEELWGRGRVDVRKVGGFRLASYACKYISKMGNSEKFMSMLSWFNLRLYSFSRAFHYRREDKCINNGYSFLKFPRDKSERAVLAVYKDEGYFVFGESLLDSS